jgi:hypothetical protein
MMNKILIVLLCLVASNLHARQVITGSLTDKETAKPVEGASVVLLQLPDSITVEMTKTNSDGLFAFYKADTIKTYCIRVKHLVYKTRLIVVPKKKGMMNNLGAIALEPNTYTFKEVVVNGSKVKVTELGDRTIYGIPDGIKKTSTDGLDVLRKVPSVQVDYLNENITVNGKSNIKIEVDGVTRDKEYLKRLHPSQIDKMEVITSPSGKYDADVDAVINIVTNPAMRFGLKGSASAMALPVGLDAYIGRVNASLDYGLEKISYYIAANGMLQKFNINSDLDRIAGGNELNRMDNMGYNGNNKNVNVGLIYDPNELNDINLNISYNGNLTKIDGDAWNYNHSDNTLNSIFRSYSNSDNNTDGITSSLFYKHKFNKNTQHGFEVELNYYKSLDNTASTDFRNVNYNPKDTTALLPYPLWQNQKSWTNTQTFTGQTNYTLPFDSVYSFNIGVSSNFNKYTIDNTSTLALSPNLIFSELRFGGYAELSRNFKKGSVKIGSRFETSHVVINSMEGSNYFSPLPYANGFFKFDDNNSIKLAYSRRVIRPTASQLNPLVSLVDSQTISKGNIHLVPAYRDNFQFTYNKKVTVGKVTVNLAPQLFYEYKTGLIQTIISQVGTTNVFESMPENVSNGSEAGAGLSVNSQIGSVLFNSNFRYSFNHIDRYLNQIDPTNQQTWNWNSFMMFPLPLDLKFISMFNISGPVLDGQTETLNSPFYMVGLVKQFKNNSTLTVISFNPFAGKFFDSTATLRNNSVYQQTDTYMKTTAAFVLVYSYNFKVGKSIEKQKHNVDQPVEENVIKLPF